MMRRAIVVVLIKGELGVQVSVRAQELEFLDIVEIGPVKRQTRTAGSHIYLMF